MAKDFFSRGFSTGGKMDTKFMHLFIAGGVAFLIAQLMNSALTNWFGLTL